MIQWIGFNVEAQEIRVTGLPASLVRQREISLWSEHFCSLCRQVRWLLYSDIVHVDKRNKTIDLYQIFPVSGGENHELIACANLVDILNL